MREGDAAPRSDRDPHAILGVSAESSEQEIRAAYLRAVKEHPPDRDPEAFERVRDAYRLLRDPRSRLRFLLLAADLDAPFVSLADVPSTERRFAGPDAWLEVLKETRT